MREIEDALALILGIHTAQDRGEPTARRSAQRTGSLNEQPVRCAMEQDVAQAVR
jgi:hypothetical protein